MGAAESAGRRVQSAHGPHGHEQRCEARLCVLRCGFAWMDGETDECAEQTDACMCLAARTGAGASRICSSSTSVGTLASL